MTYSDFTFKSTIVVPITCQSQICLALLVLIITEVHFQVSTEDTLDGVSQD